MCGLNIILKVVNTYTQILYQIILAIEIGSGFSRKMEDKPHSVILYQLLSYALNLNLIERIWIFRKSKLMNKCFEKLKDFREWIINFEKKIKENKD